MRVETFYDAAARSGLLTPARIGERTVQVDYRAPDESVLDGMALSTDHSMRYPASVLPDLAAGDTVVIQDQTYRVREIRAIGDGSERRATLTRL